MRLGLCRWLVVVLRGRQAWVGEWGMNWLRLQLTVFRLVMDLFCDGPNPCCLAGCRKFFFSWAATPLKTSDLLLNFSVSLTSLLVLSAGSESLLTGNILLVVIKSLIFSSMRMKVQSLLQVNSLTLVKKSLEREVVWQWFSAMRRRRQMNSFSPISWGGSCLLKQSQFSWIHTLHCSLALTATMLSWGSNVPKMSISTSYPIIISFSRYRFCDSGRVPISDSRHRISSVSVHSSQHSTSASSRTRWAAWFHSIWSEAGVLGGWPRRACQGEGWRGEGTGGREGCRRQQRGLIMGREVLMRQAEISSAFWMWSRVRTIGEAAETEGGASSPGASCCSSKLMEDLMSLLAACFDGLFINYNFIAHKIIDFEPISPPPAPPASPPASSRPSDCKGRSSTSDEGTEVGDGSTRRWAKKFQTQTGSGNSSECVSLGRSGTRKIFFLHLISFPPLFQTPTEATRRGTPPPPVLSVICDRPRPAPPARAPQPPKPLLRPLGKTAIVEVHWKSIELLEMRRVEGREGHSLSSISSVLDWLSSSCRSRMSLWAGWGRGWKAGWGGRCFLMRLQMKSTSSRKTLYFLPLRKTLKNFFTICDHSEINMAVRLNLTKQTTPPHSPNHYQRTTASCLGLVGGQLGCGRGDGRERGGGGVGRVQRKDSGKLLSDHYWWAEFGCPSGAFSKDSGSVSGGICMISQFSVLLALKACTLATSKQKQGKIRTSSSSKWLSSLGMMRQSWDSPRFSAMVYWYLPNCLVTSLLRAVLVKPFQYMRDFSTMRGSGVSMPRNSSPMLRLARLEFSWLNMVSSFLTRATMGARRWCSLALREWLTFLQAQLPVQRYTKHLRAAYFSFLNLASTSSRSRMSATSLNRKDSTLVVASSFPPIELLIISMQLSYSFLSVVANASSSRLRTRRPSRPAAIITPSIWFLKQLMCGSQEMASMRSPCAVSGSMGSPEGSGMVLTHPSLPAAQQFKAPIQLLFSKPPRPAPPAFAFSTWNLCIWGVAVSGAAG